MIFGYNSLKTDSEEDHFFKSNVYRPRKIKFAKSRCRTASHNISGKNKQRQRVH